MDNFETQGGGKGGDDELQGIFGSAALLFVVGFIMGSGRWNVLTSSGNRLVSQLGTMALNHAVESFRDRVSEGSSRRKSA